MVGMQLIGRFVAVALLVSATTVGAAPKLAALAADPARTSVSGLSSGGFMAVQYDVAFSASTVGVGVVAGGPYDCGYVNLGGAFTCMQGAPSGANSEAAAKTLAAAGQIDPVENLARAKVYLFSGKRDKIVSQTVMDAVRDFYRLEHVLPTNLTYVNTVEAGHAFISLGAKSACDANESPFVNRCVVDGAPYDQPGAILGQVYGPLQARTPTASLSAKPVAFDQSEFTSLFAAMDLFGYVYVPAACGQSGGTGCAVHVVFHGCAQGASVAEAGDWVYRKAGYNEWADANHLIILYPQLLPGTCWDWVGSTGLNFQTRKGAQLSAVHAMVARLTGK